MYSCKTKRSQHAPVEPPEKIVRRAASRIGRRTNITAPGVIATTPRVCLKCNEPFDSYGIHNRLCSACHQSNARV